VEKFRENAGMLSPHALELAQTLVRINTVSANPNLELIHFVRDELAHQGEPVRHPG
jgi:acetylornithine deacetylase